MSNLDEKLAALRAGEIGFDAFVRGTAKEFASMAKYLMRRWTPPEWVTPEDVVQDLYLGAWDAVPRFDPSRGVSLARFVVYGSMSKAKRTLHKARGVTISGSPDRKLSRFELNLSSIHEGDALAENLLAESPIAEALLVEREERREAYARAMAVTEPGTRERIAVLAIAEGGDISGAARVLYDDVDVRVDLRLGSEEIAERWIMSAAKAVAERLAMAARGDEN